MDNPSLCRLTPPDDKLVVNGAILIDTVKIPIWEIKIVLKRITTISKKKWFKDLTRNGILKCKRLPGPPPNNIFASQRDTV